MDSHQQQLESLKAQNARLKKAASDNLGLGYWGLVTDKKFTHEEIVFLFARIFNALNFESVDMIRTDFPDCKAKKNNKVCYIEFEPYLSNFKDHVAKKHDLSKCNYIICWEDDLEKHSLIKEQINIHNIEVIELRKIWNITKTKKKPKTYEWTKKDFGKMTENKLKVLSTFIKKDKNLLTKDEIGGEIEKTGRALGGSLKAFNEYDDREWILGQTPKGWKFNNKYRKVIREVLQDFEMI